MNKEKIKFCVRNIRSELKLFKKEIKRGLEGEGLDDFINALECYYESLEDDLVDIEKECE